VANFPRVEKWVVERKDRTTRNTEYGLDPELLESPNDRLCSGYRFRRPLRSDS